MKRNPWPRKGFNPHRGPLKQWLEDEFLVGSGASRGGLVFSDDPGASYLTWEDIEPWLNEVLK